MDIGFSEEQELLRDSARRFLEAECDTQFVRQRMAEPAGVTDELWGKLSEQGWLGIIYPEEDGGSGLGLVDLVVLMEEMGRAVMPGPFFSTVLLGGAAIAEAGSAAQRREWLPRIAAGSAKAALAWTEPNLRWDASGIALPAREAGGGYTLSGSKLFVGDAHLADLLVVAARTRDGSTMEDGVSLFLARKTPLELPLRHCRRSTRPANCARSGSITLRSRPNHCSGRGMRAGRPCRASSRGRPWRLQPKCAAARNRCWI